MVVNGFFIFYEKKISFQIFPCVLRIVCHENTAKPREKVSHIGQF